MEHAGSGEKHRRRHDATQVDSGSNDSGGAAGATAGPETPTRDGGASDLRRRAHKPGVHVDRAEHVAGKSPVADLKSDIKSVMKRMTPRGVKRRTTAKAAAEAGAAQAEHVDARARPEEAALRARARARAAKSEPQADDGADALAKIMLLCFVVAVMAVAAVLYQSGDAMFASTAARPAAQGRQGAATVGKPQPHPSGRQVRASEARLRVTLEDVFVGNTVTVRMQRQEVCPVCGGSGADPDAGMATCPQCGGAGHQVFMQRFSNGMTQRFQQTCQRCGGSGHVPGKACPKCGGHKLVNSEPTLRVPLERGMATGDAIVLYGEGNQHPGAGPGDVHFVVNVQPHKVYRRVGDDLVTQVTVSLADALRGFSREFPKLDGSGVTTVVAPPSTDPGTQLRIEGAGMPVRGSWGAYGDLLVDVVVEFPRRLSQEKRKRIAALLPE